jgi:excisionase family DNA binding protein
MSADLTSAIRTLALALPEGASVSVPRAWLLEQLTNAAAQPLQSPPSASRTNEPSTFLTVATAAERLNVKPSYLYRHRASLPFLSRVGSRTLRVDAAKLERYMARSAVR